MDSALSSVGYAPDSTDGFCQENGWHILLRFFMRNLFCEHGCSAGHQNVNNSIQFLGDHLAQPIFVAGAWPYGSNDIGKLSEVNPKTLLVKSGVKTGVNEA